MISFLIINFVMFKNFYIEERFYMESLFKFVLTIIFLNLQSFQCLASEFDDFKATLKRLEYGLSGLMQILHPAPQPKNLKKKNFFSGAEVSLSPPELWIAGIPVHLQPVQLCYYFHFLKAAFNKQDPEHFGGISAPASFFDTVFGLHEELFPDLDLNRQAMKKMHDRNLGLDIRTFQSNVSRINGIIKRSLQDPNLADLFRISTRGGKGSKHYYVKAAPRLIKFSNETLSHQCGRLSNGRLR